MLHVYSTEYGGSTELTMLSRKLTKVMSRKLTMFPMYSLTKQTKLTIFL